MGLFGGGGGEAKMKVTKYYLSLHVGVCQGPVDAIKRVWVGEKLAWAGNVTQSVSTALLRDGLFGGLKKEGGVAGTIDMLLGADEQIPSPMLIKKLRKAPEDVPGFRGITSLLFYGGGEVWPDMTNWKPDDTDTGGLFGGVRGIFAIFSFFGKKSFYWGTQPYIKPVWVTVQRIPLRSLSPTTAPVPRGTTIAPTALYIAIDISNSMDTVASNGKTRLENMKTSLTAALQDVESKAAAGLLDIMVVGFAASTVSITRRNVGPSGFQAIIDWINDRDYSDVLNGATRFDDAVEAAHTFFQSSGSKAPVSILITDGEPGDYVYDEMSAAENAQAAKDLLFRTPGLTAYGINIDLADTTYTAYVDNTTSDGVPVVQSGDPGDLQEAFNRTLIGVFDANPANVIYECLTDTDWGMGADPESLDTPSFEAAAQRLYDEQFGVFMTWMQQSSIEAFIDDVLDHIKGAIYPHPRTGKITLRLLRDDLNHGSLKEITPDNTVLTNFSRKGWGETVNEVVVSWTNPDTEKSETVRAQDLANLAQQGTLVSSSKNYYGIRTPRLAQRVAERELREASAPLASCEVEAGPEFWDVVPFDGLKVTWPEFGLNGLVMRVMKVNYGDSASSTIRLSLVEDVFAVPLASYVPPASGEWTDPTASPLPVTHTWMMPFPLYFVDLVSGTVNDLTHPETGVVVLAANTTDDESAVFDVLWGAPTPSGDTAWEWVQTERRFLGQATLASDLGADVTTADLVLADMRGWWLRRDDIVLIGDSSLAADELEMALVIAVDEESGLPTVRRGVLDTVPRRWPAGTQVWLTDKEMWRPLPRDLVDGDSFSLKLLTRTGEGAIDESWAPETPGVAASRATLPYRPGALSVNGSLFVDEDSPVAPPFALSWEGRNRLTETGEMLPWDGAGVTPETGVTYDVVIDALDSAMGELSTVDTVNTGSITSITLDPGTYTLPAGTTYLRATVTSLRDGLPGWQSPQAVMGLVQPPENVAVEYVPVFAPGSLDYLLIADDVYEPVEAPLNLTYQLIQEP